MAKETSLSYREVVPDNSTDEEWTDINIKTGATLSTLQDIKISERAGGYCFKNVDLIHNRNRFIYWRIYGDILELSEISLDFNLYNNKLRYKVEGSPIISVTITELEKVVCLLITTVCSLHRINFPHPDTLADGSSGSSSSRSGSGFSTGSSVGTSIDFHESQSFSIFREASAAAARDPNSFYVFDTQSIINSTTFDSVPNCSASYLTSSGDESYFALSWQSELVIYLMNSATGVTVGQTVKTQSNIPRIFGTLKDVFTGKTETSDEQTITSMVFNCINGEMYLVAMYRNNLLRVWSTTTMQCVGSINCSRDGQIQRNQGAQMNLLRKINEQSICIYLSHSKSAEFLFMDLKKETNNTFTFEKRHLISAPKLDLSDFDASETRIWGLWSNSEGDFSISNFCLVRFINKHWITAAMEPPPDRNCVGIDRGMDPREAFCSYIFHPGKFDRSVITKALFMFCRSNVLLDSILSLKEQVSRAVEEEIHNEIKDFEVSDDEYLEIANRWWERFYSCCEQYHTKSCQPLGLCILEPIDAVCIVKKSTFSLLRPCETLEHIILSGETDNVNSFVSTDFQKGKLDENVVNLIAVIGLIEKWLPDEIKLDMDKKFYYLEPPLVVIDKLIEEITTEDAENQILPRNYLLLLQQKLQYVSDFLKATKSLLDFLRLDNENAEEQTLSHFKVAQSSRLLLSIGALFGSNVGVSFLSETVRQTVAIRFAICRNLVILFQIISVTNTIEPEDAEIFRSQFMSHLVIFLQSYFVMVWISEKPLNMNSMSSLETSIQRLNLLDLINGSGRIYSSGGKYLAAPLLRVFLNSKGLYSALNVYCNHFANNDNLSWQKTLLPLTSIVCQLIWPVSFDFTFGEWLFSTCQHVLIADYVRLLSNWCEWNMHSRKFILGVSLLDTDETYKAFDLFLQAAKGVFKEEYLHSKILKYKTNEEESTTNAISNSYNNTISYYYTRIIQLFERYGALNFVIKSAKVAIGLLKGNDPHVPMFQSIIFNNHLKLDHFEDAYDSLVNNADSTRRKDCLRQLVLTLFNRKRFDLLNGFSYSGLEEEFQNIVESRARSLVIENNNIYEFLFAYHVQKSNFRKAAAVMYEQAMRCQLESDTLEMMDKRCVSLLICINALNLTDERYQWIAKPIINDDDNMITSNSELEDEDNMLFEQDEKIAVLEIGDIEKELMLAEAIMRLADVKDVKNYHKTGPQELSMILASNGLYIDAVRLAKGFNLPLNPIIDNLAAASVLISEESSNEAWKWLQENNLTDLPHRDNVTEMAWLLLQKIIKENETENTTQIRKTVVKKLLSLNAFLPQWLHNEYKATNCAELLSLYVKHNRLLEAADLAVEMIKAMLGAGSEYFSFKHSIAVTNRVMCLPINTLDVLLCGLRENSEEDVEYKVVLVELEEIISKYLKTAMRTAEDKVQMAYLAKVDAQRAES